MKLGLMIIFVSDLEVAKQFYCDTLGFPLKAERSNCIELEHEGCEFKAFKCDENQTVKNYSRVARSVFVFKVDSLDKSFRELRDNGVTFLHERPAENEFSRYVAFTDPFGNVHELYEPKN